MALPPMPPDEVAALDQSYSAMVDWLTEGIFAAERHLQHGDPPERLAMTIASTMKRFVADHPEATERFLFALAVFMVKTAEAPDCDHPECEGAAGE